MNKTIMEKCNCGEDAVYKAATGKGIEFFCKECGAKAGLFKLNPKRDMDDMIKELKVLEKQAGNMAIIEIPTLGNVDLLWNYIGCLSGIPLESDEDKEYYVKVTNELIKRRFLNKVRNYITDLNKAITVEEFKEYQSLHKEPDLTFYQYKAEVLKMRETLIRNPDIVEEFRRLNGIKIV